MRCFQTVIIDANVNFHIARLKIVYDQHCEETLLLGVKDVKGEYHGGYIYQ